MVSSDEVLDEKGNKERVRYLITSLFYQYITVIYLIIRVYQRGLAKAYDLAAFRLSMITPVKKSVSHPRTVGSMRETGWEQQLVRLRSNSTV